MTPQQQAAAAIAAAQAVVANAPRLGLVWDIRPATVVDSDATNGVTIIYDGDTARLHAISLIGNPAIGARIMCLIVPPSGNFIIGRIGVNGVQLTTLADASATSQVTLSGADQSMPGTLTTVTTQSEAAMYEVTGIFDFRETVAGTTTCIGKLYVDGVALTKQAIFTVSAVTDRATVPQTWAGSFTSSGDHTFELYVVRTAAAGTQIAANIHTGMTVKIYE